MATIRHRLFLWLLILSFALINACSSHQASAYNYSIKPNTLYHSDTPTSHPRINILSSYLIKTKKKDSYPIVELSDLAWDEDEQLLYSISDEGLLYHLRIEINKNYLSDVKIVAAMPLLDNQHQALKGKYSDAEGLTLLNANNGKRGDSQLIVAFENKPRIAKFSIKGQFLSKVQTVNKLRQRKSYRGNNKALESVALHPQPTGY